MSRRILVLYCLLITVLRITVLIEAQQRKKVFRIGYLATQPTALDSDRRQEIRQVLSRFGYVDGQNISTEYRSAEGDTARLPALAAELVKLQLDLIVVAGGLGHIRAAADGPGTTGSQKHCAGCAGV